MAISNVSFSIGVDNSKSIAGIKQVKSEMQNLSSVAGGEVSKRLKAIFTATAIEEAARRTGEWANNLQKTSKALGLSAEALQLLQQISRKSNTPEDAIVGMFENINKARQDAINGNADAIKSFQALGVTMEDLQSLNAEDLFSKAVGNMGNIQKQGGIQREAAQNITGGTPENFISAIASGLKGGMKENIDKGKEGGNIASNTDVGELSAMWSEVKGSLYEMFIAMLPAIKIIVALILTVVNAVAGITDLFKGSFDVIAGILKGDLGQITTGFKNIGGILMNGVLGILKGLAMIMDLIPNIIRNTLGKLPGVAGKMVNAIFPESDVSTKIVKKMSDAANEWMGTSENIKKHGEAVGDVFAIAASGGEAAIGKVGDIALTKVAVMTDKIGMQAASDMALKGALKMGRVAKGEGILGGKSITESLTDTLSGTTKNGHKKLIANMEEPGYEMGSAGKSVMSRAKVAARVIAGTKGVLAMSGITGIAGAAVGLPEAEKGNEKGTPIFGTKAAGGNWGGVGGKGGGGNLSIGGTFGTGFNDKMINLTQQMVTILGQIKTNTLANRGREFTQPDSGFGRAGGF